MGIVLAVVAAAAGFAAGRMGGKDAVEAGADGAAGKARHGAMTDGADDEAQRDARRPRRTERKEPAEGRISMPKERMAKLLRERYFVSTDHTNLGRSIQKALEMLGVDEEARNEVDALLKGTVEELLRREQEQVKVKKADSTEIIMDLSGMQEPVDELVARNQEGLRAALPADTAEMLVETIRWERFYFRDEHKESRFNIVRNGEGGMSAMYWWMRSAGAGSLISQADDGTPIPAEELFGERWRKPLKGLTLLPVDKGN